MLACATFADGPVCLLLLQQFLF